MEKMKLEKKSESVFRYLENGEMKERVDMKQYALTAGDTVKGDLYVYADHADLRLNVEGFSTVEECDAKVREMMAKLCENESGEDEPGEADPAQ